MDNKSKTAVRKVPAWQADQFFGFQILKQMLSCLSVFIVAKLWVFNLVFLAPLKSATPLIYCFKKHALDVRQHKDSM